MPFVPSTFTPPKIYTDHHFCFVPLTEEMVQVDYDAVMSSIDIIHKTRGRGDGWPSPSMTLEENRKDLVWHREEFERGDSFAYAVYDVDQTEYLGCFYLYPPGTRGEDSRDADVDVSFWVTQAAYDAGCYEKLYESIRAFLEDCPFQNIAYTNVLIPGST